MIDEQNAIYDSVSGLVFMGTPHAGSHVADKNRIKTLKLLAKAISMKYPEKLASTLSAHSGGLLNRSNDFEKTTIFTKHEIEICTYYEIKTLSFLGSEEVRTDFLYLY
jgi:triacylglycerol esterase/lipase EstA (alpha/beta hydrolase family)